MKTKRQRFGLGAYLTACMVVLLSAACGGGDKKAMGCIPVKSGEKWGYVDSEGKWLINPQFESVDAFHEGWAVVQRENGEYGFTDTDGKIMNDAWYKGATRFSSGKAWVVAENTAPVLIDTKGNKLSEVREALRVYSYTEGLAMALVKDEKTGRTLYGYLDGKGKWAIKPQFESVGAFSEGRAAVARTNEEKNRMEHGYIDKSGALVIPYQFAYARHFEKNGKAVVSINGDNGWVDGVIDRDGHYLITPQFGSLMPDGDELTCSFSGTDLYGRCDQDGKVIVNPQFKNLTLFFDGKLAPASLDGEKVGYVDRTGHFVINPQFDYASPFAGGIAIVRVGDKFGFIDTDGKYKANPQFDGVDPSVIEVYYGIPGVDHVESDFFDASYIAGKLKDAVKDGGMNGYTLGMTVGDIMTKAGLDEDRVSRSESGTTRLFYDPSWLAAASLRLEMKGDFFDSVSDGWWGYVKVIDKKRRPTSFVCTVAISDYGKKNKQPLLFEAVKKVFGAEGKNKVTRDGYTYELSSDNEGIHIIIRK